MGSRYLVNDEANLFPFRLECLVGSERQLWWVIDNNELLSCHCNSITMVLNESEKFDAVFIYYQRITTL